ncbi:hypothetical protein LTR66_014639, partial [Elasticomyces elasticus]
MARSHLAIALVAASIALLAIFQLVAQYGFPQLDYWHWRQAKLEYAGHNGKQQVLQDAQLSADEYMLGVGKADITGPVVEINFMGYADPAQLGTGVRQRLYSRAFIVRSPSSPEDCFIYLVLDTQSGDTAVRHGILEGLAGLGPEYAMYNQQNVAVTGTHSHSGPGAWLNYLLPQITSRGFNKQSYRVIVDGAVESIRLAHESLTLGSLNVGTIELLNANTNRSPFAYLANPEEERANYEHDVDKELTMLRLRRSSDGKDIGVLTWFPVHGTSMLGNNTLVTGDNKGVAAHLFERSMRDSDSAAEDFVAGFSQANVGDTSPNILGAYCESGPQEGEQCDFETSLCDGRNEPCHGRGPHYGLGDAGTASCYEIGRRQYAGARKLYDSMQASASASIPIHGSAVRSVHAFIDFSNYTFELPNGTTTHTCPAALGYSFAAGTTDGPGAFDFKQGSSDANPFWAAVRDSLHTPDEAQVACQAPKRILLDVGETTRPYLWSPNIVDIQFLHVGNLFIIVSPGEATTMAGRRWKKALASTVQSSDSFSTKEHTNPDPIVVLGGPANTYTHYISTPEEYGVQRYEGASTLYGPHTLDAYIS